MSEAFFTVFPNTWGHVYSQFLFVFGSFLCTFLLLALICFPGIHLNPGISSSLNFPEEYPHTKALVSNVEFTSGILEDVKKKALKQFCFLKSSLLLPLLPKSHLSPFLQHPYAFPILLSFLMHLYAAPYPMQFSHSSSMVHNSLPLI